MWPFARATEVAAEPMVDADWLVFGPPVPPHSCINCAWLRKEINNISGPGAGNLYSEFEEVPEGERRNGFRHHDEIFAGTWFTCPTCRVRGRNLPQEVEEVSGNRWDGKGAKQVIRRDRGAGAQFPCPRFFPWVQHYTFVEHFEYRRVLLLEESRSSEEIKLRSLDRRVNLVQAGVAGFVGLLAVCVAVVAIIVSARFNIKAAELQRDAQPTIQVTPTINVLPAPVNVTVPTPSPSTPNTASPQPTGAP